MHGTDADAADGSPDPTANWLKLNPGSEYRLVEVVDGGRVAYRPREVAQKLGVSPRYVYALMERGDLHPVILANRQMILAEELARFIGVLKQEHSKAIDSADGAA